MLRQEIPPPWLDSDNLKETIKLTMNLWLIIDWLMIDLWIYNLSYIHLQSSKLEEKEEIMMPDENVCMLFYFSTNSPSQALPVFVVI